MDEFTSNGFTGIETKDLREASEKLIKVLDNILGVGVISTIAQLHDIQLELANRVEKEKEQHG